MATFTLVLHQYCELCIYAEIPLKLALHCGLIEYLLIEPRETKSSTLTSLYAIKTPQ